MKNLHKVILPALAIALVSLAGCDLSQDAPPSASIAAFGSVHSALGDATLETRNESMTVAMDGPGSAGGVAVELGAQTRLNVYFEPIEMPVGSLFETAVVGQIEGRDEVLGRITHRQTGPTTTAIGVDFHDLQKYTDSREVTVATYLDGVQTSSKKLPVDSTSTLGTVNSGSSGWATSYHWVWIDGSWILMVDPAPSETFTFAGDPGVQYNFNYLVFTVEGVDGVSRPSTMEFYGEGVPDFTITGEDQRRLIY